MTGLEVARGSELRTYVIQLSIYQVNDKSSHLVALVGPRRPHRPRRPRRACRLRRPYCTAVLTAPRRHSRAVIRRAHS